MSKSVRFITAAILALLATLVGVSAADAASGPGGSVTSQDINPKE